jgi:DNA-binding NarL/FixJ family response regulator
MKTLIVDHYPLIRDALAKVLLRLGERVQVLQAESLSGALAELEAHPDTALIVLELTLPDAKGTRAIERVRAARPHALVVVLSAMDDRGTVLAALDGGARGFISKRSTSAVLVNALRLVLAGGMYIPETLSLLAPTPDLLSARAPLSGIDDLNLTRRQSDVLRLLGQGKANKVISRELGVAQSTVKAHVAAILRALGVSNRTQAACKLNRLGIKLPSAPSPTVVNHEAERDSGVNRVNGTASPHYASALPVGA